VRVTVLGCGTSGGVPRADGHWGACDPTEPRNRRRRASILVERAGRTLIVDTSPDLREQCLAQGVRRIDAVLYTHDHADHTHGIDDLRSFAFAQDGRVPVWGTANTLATLAERFGYIFASHGGYPAICEAHQIDGPFSAAGIAVRPFEQRHGRVTSLGFRFGPLAYSTDLNGLDEAAFAVLDGIEVWIVDALRREPHPTHAHLEMTLGWIARVQPRRAILTHMTWGMDYRTLLDSLPTGIEPAYDGLTITLDDR
jgi:phosphoribosyl 1,2-cyclic phosphate phosphodiesterase